MKSMTVRSFSFQKSLRAALVLVWILFSAPVVTAQSEDTYDALKLFVAVLEELEKIMWKKWTSIR
jgi:hypothetical protein